MRLHQMKYDIRKELIFQEWQLGQSQILIKRSIDLNYYRDKTTFKEDC